jgi:nucleoside 2-deoxyribosyltransferase
MRAIAQVLEDAGFQTFLPQRDGLEGYLLRFAKVPLPSILSEIRTRLDYAIFSLDVYELLVRCEAVVCNLNGRVPDEGMIVEASLAYAAGKSLILFKDDVRAPFGGYDNAMLTSLGQGKIVKKRREIPAIIAAEMSQPRAAVTLSPDLQKAVAAGKRISSFLASLPQSLGKQQWSDEVIRQVMVAAFQEE